MHKKTFEWVQTIYGLRILNRLNKTHLALGVGSGHECIVYWLARYFQRVYATDLFQGAWTTEGGTEGDNAVLKDPDKYRPFDYPRDRLRFLPMDGRFLGFRDNSFEVVFSLSSIEHFGGKEMAASAMREIGRVLKPGGVAVVATEYVLNGVEHPEFFNERDLLDYVVNPSGLKLMQDICFEVPSILLEKPLIFPDEKYLSPHLSLMDGEAIFTSIILFFEKI
jgi:SAM-dependent methyltransferase